MSRPSSVNRLSNASGHGFRRRDDRHRCGYRQVTVSVVRIGRGSYNEPLPKEDPHCDLDNTRPRPGVVRIQAKSSHAWESRASDDAQVHPLHHACARVAAARGRDRSSVGLAVRILDEFAVETDAVASQNLR